MTENPKERNKIEAREQVGLDKEAICSTCGRKFSYREDTPGHLQVICEDCRIIVVL